MTSTSNHYRKVRALVAKTVAAGCTPQEHVAATNLAATIVEKHGLDATRIDWPAPPAGHAWSGEPGRSVIVEIPAKPKRQPRAAKPAEPKTKAPTRKEQIIEMLRTPDGTTIDAIVARFGVQRHSARAAVSVFGREIGGVSYDKATKIYRALAS